MMRERALPQVETDLAALRSAADRAGTALACLFSSSDEFEAAVISTRRARLAARSRARGHRLLRTMAATAALALILLML